MNIFKARNLPNIITILLLLGMGYYLRADIGRLWRQFFSQSFPCQTTITYSIGDIDSRFNLSKSQVLEYVQKAEKIWEDPAGRNLFKNSTDGDLKISLIYDDRQKAADVLKTLGIKLNNDQATFNALKAKHEQLLAAYRRDKARIDALVFAYNVNGKSYQDDAAYWNSRGGAPKNEYDALEKRRLALSDELAAINNARAAFNASIDVLNSTTAALNHLINSLNLQVDKYNAVGASNGEEYSEGIYSSDARGTKIDIYQFKDPEELIQLLAHELGHALGLEHLQNPKAIMYYLNEGASETITVDDLSALKSVCKIK